MPYSLRNPLTCARDITVRALVLHEGRQSQDAANGANVHAEQHTTEAGGQGENESPPSVDFGRVWAACLACAFHLTRMSWTPYQSSSTHS